MHDAIAAPVRDGDMAVQDAPALETEEYSVLGMADRRST